MSKTFAVIGITLLVLCGIGGCARLDFWLWRKEHPAAPTWTYFFHSSR